MKKPLRFHSIFAALAGTVTASTAATLTQTAVIGVGIYSDPGWSQSGSFSFNQPYTRLVSTSYRFFGGATVSNKVTNSGSSNLLGIVSGSASFTLERNGRVIDSMTVALRGSTIIPPKQSSVVGDSEYQVKNGTLSSDNSSGTFVIRSTGGTGPNLGTIGDFTITYTYDPIGDTADDPISPTILLGGLDTFSGIPTGRWFEMDSTGPMLIESTDSGTFRQFAASFMGAGAYRLSANGVDLGEFAGDQVVNLAAGTTKLELSDVRGDFQSAALRGSGSLLNFQVVPEPASYGIFSLTAVFALVKRRRIIA